MSVGHVTKFRRSKLKVGASLILRNLDKPPGSDAYDMLQHSLIIKSKFQQIIMDVIIGLLA